MLIFRVIPASESLGMVSLLEKVFHKIERCVFIGNALDDFDGIINITIYSAFAGMTKERVFGNLAGGVPVLVIRGKTPD
jgi:hypothetical protein